MTDVSIFDIDLSEEIPAIISQKISDISEGTRKQIQAHIAVAEAKEQVKQQRVLVKQSTKQAIESKLESAYQMLLEAKESGVNCVTIAELIKPHITTTSAFTLRMKSLLKDRNGEWELIREKQRYYLRPYNQ